MSAIGSATLDGTILSRLAGNSVAVKAQLDAALEQQSSGHVSGDYAGLGAGGRTSLDLGPSIQHLATWQSNIDSATTRLGVTQSALTEIGSIAADFRAQVANINGVGVSEVGLIAGKAKLALEQVGQLLNTKVGDVYVFAGQDTGNPPVPNTDPAVTGPALLASDTATAPFSTTLGTATPTVEVGDGQRVPIGLLANQNTLSVSQPPTTGSYMRDVMRALANLANMVDTPANTVANQATARDVLVRLGSAVGALSDEQGALGDLQASLTTRKASMAATALTLTTQISNVQDVDMAATLTRIQALQTQLQASYQLIAGVKGMSLVNFL